MRSLTDTYHSVPSLVRRGVLPALFCLGLLIAGWPGDLPPAVGASQDELQVDVRERGLGKEVTIRQGAKEWFMLIEVTPDNTIILRQEKEHDTYLVDESETHDRAFSDAEVDTAIRDYINSVKHQVKKE